MESFRVLKYRWSRVARFGAGAALAGLVVACHVPTGKVVQPAVSETQPVTSAETKPRRSDVEVFTVGNDHVRALLCDGPILWAATSNGLLRYDTRDNQHRILTTENSALISNGIMSLHKMDGRLWIGTYGGGLSIYDDISFKNYNIADGLADAFVYDFDKTAKGDIWIATWSGANRVVGGALDDRSAWETYTVENTHGGLPNDWVYTLRVDPQGILWFATEGGLARFDGATWRHWTHEEGLGAPYEKVKDDLQTIHPTKSSQHHGWQKAKGADDQGEIAYNPDYIVAMLLDSHGRILCGTWGGGLSVLENGTFKTYTSKEGLVGNYITALQQDPDGSIWVGTSQGLSKVPQGSFQNTFVNYTPEKAPYFKHIFAMEFDDKRSPWIGVAGGAIHFVHGLN